MEMNPTAQTTFNYYNHVSCVANCADRARFDEDPESAGEINLMARPLPGT